MSGGQLFKIKKTAYGAAVKAAILSGVKDKAFDYNLFFVFSFICFKHKH